MQVTHKGKQDLPKARIRGGRKSGLYLSQEAGDRIRLWHRVTEPVVSSQISALARIRTRGRVSCVKRLSRNPTPIMMHGSHRMRSIPTRCASCPTATGAIPPPNSSPTAITTPEAVAISGAGTDSEHNGPTVRVIGALFKKDTMKE